MNILPKVEVDASVLIIGGGLAGLMSAIEAARIVPGVVLVAKGRPGKSGNTIMSRNGMAAVLQEGYDGDTVEKHVKDTMEAGKGINNQRMVEVFAGRAGEAIQRLMELGVPFLTADGHILRKGSPGHSCKRFLTVDSGNVRSPQTKGLALTLPLAREAAKLGVRFAHGIIVAGLIKHDGSVIGAWGLDGKKERIWVFRAGSIVLACGGAGGLYSVSTNSSDVTGDAYALAHRAGAELTGMEFVQFHPAVALGRPGMVMSTAPFADGAVLRNKDGERYMDRYSPAMEMATRDVMARANFSEINAGRGTPNGGVLMDFTAIPERIMQRNYSDLHAYLGGRRVIEVSPAMHFMMGGVAVDETGRTSLPGLYAAGEAAGGLHGANRLAGNALTEAAVFGMIAGREAALRAGEVRKFPVSVAAEKIIPGRKYDRHLHINMGEIRKTVKKIMSVNVALVRNETGLKDAVQTIEYYKRRLVAAGINHWKELVEYHRLMLLLDAAGAVATAALNRKKSLGAHYREDIC